MAPFPVYQAFNGVLSDNTTYTLMENITRTTEFTLALDSTGIGIVWNGNGFTITANKAGWLGLFPCPVTVSRLGILSSNTSAIESGWLFQSGLGGTATNCYSTGTIGDYGGGIFGRNTTGTATNCYSTGAIGVGGGGILGLSSTGTVTNCYSVGSIALRGGGIFGSESGGTATNCYSTGDIYNQGGGIYGSDSSGTAIATNCYTTGNLGTLAGGIFGSYSSGSTVNSANTTGWDDTAAQTYLTGTPVTSPGAGAVWISGGVNTPFILRSYVGVNRTFNGVLINYTTYTMVEDVSITQPFSLAVGNDGTGIVWNGNNFGLLVTNGGWPGLFPCAVDVSNLGIRTGNTAAYRSGWFFRSGLGGTATNCYSTGATGNEGGGIFGYQSPGSATNCYSTGAITNAGGGIFGAASSGTVSNCYSTGAIGAGGGGIAGAASGGSVINSYTTGTIGANAGAIYGYQYTGGFTNSGNTTGWDDTAARTYLTGTPATSPGYGLTWDSSGLNTPFTLATGVRVNNTFDGILVDNTTYIMVANISRVAEFTLAPDNNGTGILWDGNGFRITANKAGWLGLFPCSVDVWNTGLSSSFATADNAGWFFQNNKTGSATNCFSTGDIGPGGGGIFGPNFIGTATNCYSRGDIGAGGGGIYGFGSSGIATNCYSTGSIGDYGGGIFGSDITGTAKNCYATGTLGANAGELFGPDNPGTNIQSGYTLGWDDTAARSYLTSTPVSSPGVGAVWNSNGLNTPFILNPTTACFFGDAPVLTPSGYRRIDSLRIGDTVTTLTGEDVITRIYKHSQIAGPKTNPYSIPAGTFGAVKPLLISPRHCIAVKGSMIEVRRSGLKQVAKEGVLTYYNLELKRHSTMIVAGVEVESYVPR